MMMTTMGNRIKMMMIMVMMMRMMIINKKV